MKTFQRDVSGYDTVLGTPDPLPLATTPSDYGEHHRVQTGNRNRYQRNLNGYTYLWVANISLYGNLTRRFLRPEIPR